MAKYLYMCVEQCREGDLLKNDTYLLDQHVIKGTYHLIMHTQKIMIKICVESNFLLFHGMKADTIHVIFWKV